MKMSLMYQQKSQRVPWVGHLRLDSIVDLDSAEVNNLIGNKELVCTYLRGDKGGHSLINEQQGTGEDHRSQGRF